MSQTDAITADRYETEVEMRAEDAVQSLSGLIGAGTEAKHEALDEQVSAIVADHNWFARSYYDMHLYTSVLTHAQTGGTEMPHTDWQQRIAETGSIERGLKQMAKDFFEQDVWNAALGRFSEEQPVSA